MTLGSSFLYALRLVFSKKTDGQNSNGRRSLLGAMLCIGISLVPLVVVLVISDGMISGITGRMIQLGSGDIKVGFEKYSDACESSTALEETAERLSKINGVTGASSEVQGIAMASAKGVRTGATVRGVKTDVFSANKSYRELFKVVSGTTEFKTKRSVVLGQKIAEILGVSPGDTVSLVTLDTSVKDSVMPKVCVLKVAGIVSCGYQELDALWVFVPLETAFSFLPSSNASYMVSLSTSETFSKNLQNVVYNVKLDLQGRGRNENPPLDGWLVYTWNELNTSEYENFASTKSLLLLIVILIVLVASVNISSALIMVVMERRKEIAILKSVGGSSFGVSFAFLIVGLCTGLGGVLLGVPAGLVASVNINGIINVLEHVVNFFRRFAFMLTSGDISGMTQFHVLDPAYYLTDIPIVIPFKELLVIVLTTLLLSLIVSAVPAVKAGREKPIETLRKM